MENSKPFRIFINRPQILKQFILALKNKFYADYHVFPFLIPRFSQRIITQVLCLSFLKRYSQFFKLF